MRPAARRIWRVGAAVLVATAVYAGWREFRPTEELVGFARANGRIEATEIDLAARAPGRIADILVAEGAFVEAGDVLARMDTDTLDAARREAEAHRRGALIGVETARAMVTQRQAEKQAALAVVEQRQAERDAARKRLDRSAQLARRGTIAAETLDNDRASFAGANAAVAAARANVAAVESAISAAESQVVNAQAAAEAAAATVERIEADIADAALKAPRSGRVQYLTAQTGEVVPAGGAILNLVDLTDVYMTFFLSTAEAGRTALGAEARIVLDAAPDYVIPASVTHVADIAQFTPKTVETQEERLKLMFRIKARIDPDLLRRYRRQVKTGLPGAVYVRLDAGAVWPPELNVRLPE